MSDLDEDLKRQMAAFEAARTGAPLALVPAPLRTVLCVHDGSDQDATADQLAAALAARTAAAVQPFAASAQDPLPEILAAAAGCELVVLPCPFRRDYTTERAESLSTTVDLLLARCKAALLLVRAPLDDADACLRRPLVALGIDRHRKVEATALALSLARGGGEICLQSVVDPHQPLRDEELLGRFLHPQDLSPAVLAGLASARAAALTAALQKHAGEWDLQPCVQFAVGDPVQLALDTAEQRHGVLVAGLDRDARSTAAQDARRLVLGSRWPVLLV